MEKLWKTMPATYLLQTTKLVSMKSLSCDAIEQRSNQTYSRLILSKDSRIKFLKLEPSGISPFKATYDKLNQEQLFQLVDRCSLFQIQNLSQCTCCLHEASIWHNLKDWLRSHLKVFWKFANELGQFIQTVKVQNDIWNRVLF